MDEQGVLLLAMREAGAAIIRLQRSGFSIEKKANQDIVTQADVLANEIIKSRLMMAFPEDGWLSEENHDDMNRLSQRRVWIIDPIDGTKEFAAGVPEYAISVALVANGVPILASVYNPATDELYHASKDRGAWGGKSRLHCANSTSARDILLLASRSEHARGEWGRFEKVYRVQQMGSIAYKLALVAAGRAHGTFSLGPKNEWDIAAGVLLVTEAGGIVTDKNRQEIQFNRRQVLVDGIVATTADTNNDIFALIKRRG
jgi:myo-inositol-1(or 4)-monophosphatase